MENNQIKVLVVDDLQDNLISLKALITEAFPDSTVLTAANGKTGITLAMNHNPDVILLDILMPEMDGFEVCRSLKTEPKTADIPVVFVTALKGDKESRIKALECGGEAFLSKPVDETELTAQIRAMAKIKAARVEKITEKERLEKLVAQRTEELQQELEERIRTELELREAEERFEMLFNRAPLGYQSLDINGHFINVNQQWLDLLGYSREEVVGKWFGDFLSPAFQDGFRQRFPIFKKLGQIHSEFEMVHKNGHTLFIAFDGKIGHDKQGNFKQTHCILQDITEKKKIEETLQQNQLFTNALLNGISESALLIEPDGTIIAANDTVAARFNKTKDELVGTNTYSLVSKEVAQHRKKFADLAVETRKPVQFEDVRNGRILDNRVTPILDKDGKVDRLAIIGIDITDLKLAQAKVEESEQQFRATFEQSGVGVVMVNLDQRFIRCNHTFCQFLGYAENELIGKTVGEVTHPDDLNLGLPDLKKLVKGEVELVRTRKRYLRKDGSIVWGEISITLLRGANHQPLYFLPVVQDITKAVEAEKALQYNNELFSLFLKYSPVYAFIKEVTETQSRVIKASENYVDMIGIPGSQMMGKTMEELFPPEFAAKITTDDWEVFKNGKIFREDEDLNGHNYTTIKFPITQGSKKLLAGYTIDITERKNVEIALKNSEQQLRGIFDNLQDAYFQADSDGKFVTVSPSAVKIYGFDSIDEMIGQPAERLYANSQDRLTMIKKLRETGDIKDHVLLAQKKDGSTFWVSMNVRMMFDDQGGFAGTEGVVRDITDRRQAEMALKESEERMNLAVANSPVPIMIHDEDDNVLLLSKGWTDYSGYTIEDIPTLGDWTEKAYGSRLGNEKSYIDNLFEINHTVNNGEWIVTAKDGSKRIWDFQTTPLGKVFRGKRVLHSLAIDVTERKQAEEAIKESEERYRLLENNSMDAILLTSPEGSVYSANRAACEMFQMTEQEICTAGRLGLVDLTDPRLQTFLDTREKTGRARGEIYMFRKDGTRFPVEISSTIYHDSTGKVKTSMILRDITDRKKAEEALLENEELYRSLHESTGVGIGYYRPDGTVISFNQVAAKNMGGNPEDFAGKSIFDFFPREEAEFYYGRIQQSLESETPVEYEDYVSLPGGDIWFFSTFSKITNKKGDILGVQIISQNITERKKIELELEKSKKFLLDTQAIANLGTYTHDILTGWWESSEILNRIFGIDDKYPKNVEGWIKLVHPEHQDMMANHLAIEVVAQRGRFDKVYKIIRYNDKQTRWVHGLGELTFDSKGNPVKMIGTIRDITDQKVAEDALVEKELQYRTLANSGEALIYTTDADKACTYVNEPTIKFTGLTFEQELGDGWAESIHPDDALAIFQKYSEVFDKRESYSIEYRLRHVSGEYRWIRDMGSPNYNSAGQFIGYIGYCFDITERKHAENALVEKELQYRTLANSGTALIWTSGLDKLCNYFNEPWLRFTGRTLEQELGNGWAEGVHPDDFDYCVDTYVTAFDKQEPFEMEYRLRHNSGEYRWIVDMGTPNYNRAGQFIGYIGYCFDITENKKAAEELAKLTKRQGAILGSVPDIIMEVDNNKIYTWANQAGLEFFGNDVLGKEASYYFEGEQETYSLVNKIFEGDEETIYIESWQRRKDGEKRLLAWWCKVLKDPSGNTTGALSTARDITDQNKMAEVLKKSEAQLSSFMKFVPDLVLIKDHELRPVYANDEYRKLFPIDEWMGKKPHELFPADVADTMVAKDTEALTKGYVSYEETWEDQNHKKHVFLTQKFRIPIPGSEPLLGGIISDITERKLAEDALRESEERYRSVVNVSPDGIIIHYQGKVVFVNQTIMKLFGATNEKDLIGKQAIDYVHPDDRKNAMSRIVEMYKTGIPAPVAEERMLKLDGTPIFVEVAAAFTPFEGKQASLVVMRDITERKQAEEALRQSQALYYSFIEQLPNPVFRKDIEGRFILVNSEFCKLKGQPREDFIGKKPLEVSPSKFSGPGKDSDKMVYENLGEKIHGQILKTGKTFIEEEQYYAADGSEIFKQVMRMPVADSDGNIIGSQGIMFDITERKKTEEELQKSYDLLTKLTNQVPGVVYQYRLYPDGHSAFPISSSGMFDIYEVTSEEVREDASPVFTRLHPEDLDYIVETINESARNLTHYQSEFRVILPKQGLRWRWCDAKPEKLDDGSVLWYGIITDITERKNAEEQMLKLSKAVTQSPDSIVITDVNGNIEYVNPKFTEVCGYSFEEAMGQNPRILKSGEYPQEFYKELWDTILSGNEWRGEIPNRKKNGELIWESATISPIVNDKGKITHFVSIKQDITEKKKIYNDLIKAKEKAEESDRLKSAFLANMSHEIRTPMNGILGFTEMLKEPDLEEKEKVEFISIIEKSGNRMLNTINDIIDFSKIESGQMEVNRTEFNLGQLLNEVYSFFRLEVEQKGLDFKLRTCSSTTDAQVFSDSQKLYGVLANLVKNAIKFTQHGSIEIGCKKKESGFELYVLDSGVGIKPEQQEYIFDRFRQGSESLTRQYEGSGLGLAISRAYVEMLGGTIGVESEPGKGSRFFFTIPGKDNKVATAEPIPEVHIPESDKLSDKLKVLIVEDDPGSELLLTISLKKLNSRIIIARNGTDAIETCRKNPDLNLILMDINMPVMDGLEATKRIREFNKEVVVIAQTAYALAGDREKALAAGCNDYITKPIQKEDLLAMIRHYTSGSQT